MKKNLIYVIFAGVFFMSCSGVNETTRGDAKTSPRLREDIKFFDAAFKAKINFGDATQGASVSLKCAGKDSMFMEIYGPFSIKVGQLFANKNKFVMKNMMNGKYYIGEPTAEAFEKAAQIPLGFEELASILRAEPIFQPKNYKIESGDPENPYDVYKIQKKGFDEFLSVSTQNNLLSSIERKNRFGDVVFIARFSDYSDFEGIRYPGEINVDFPYKGNLNLEVKKISFSDSPVSRMSFDVPENAKIERID